MSGSFSITRRLAFGLTVGTALFWIGAVAISSLVIERELNQAFDETLRQSAVRLLPLALEDLDELSEGEERSVSGLDDDHVAFTYFIRNRNGDLIVLADDLPLEQTGVKVPDGFSTIESQRYYALTDPQSGYAIVVVENSGHRGEALSESVLALLLPLAALIPLMAAGIWFATGLAMRPVTQLSQEIAQRDGRDLSPVPITARAQELQPITLEIENLLDRLRAALGAERAFAANSAHELRTPIAGALAQVQRLTIELDGKAGSERAREIERALRHLSSLSEKLLQLSRLEAGFTQVSGVVDLKPVVDLIMGDFTGSQTHKPNLILHLPKKSEIKSKMDEDAFAIVLRNLIQNALLHGDPEQLVEISLPKPGRLTITNGGPPMSSRSLERIGEPFQRGTTNAEGTGLGLSIVRSIMEQSGGQLILHSPVPGRLDGFMAELILPTG